MSEIVVTEDSDSLALTVSPDPDVNLSLTTSDTTVVVVDSLQNEEVVLTPDGDSYISVSSEPSIVVKVTKEQESNVEVYEGDVIKATSLSQLNDVDLASGVEDGMSIFFDTATETWIPQAGVTEDALNQHINSPTPHPVYDQDNGPSLLLLYQNAKV